MSKLNNGPISSNDLMSKLVQAKKLMNKVDTGDFERGNIDESKLMAPSNDSDYLSESYEQNQPQVNAIAVCTPTADRIQQSK